MSPFATHERLSKVMIGRSSFQKCYANTSRTSTILLRTNNSLSNRINYAYVSSDFQSPAPAEIKTMLLRLASTKADHSRSSRLIDDDPIFLMYATALIIPDSARLYRWYQLVMSPHPIQLFHDLSISSSKFCCAERFCVNIKMNSNSC